MGRQHILAGISVLAENVLTKKQKLVKQDGSDVTETKNGTDAYKLTFE